MNKNSRIVVATAVMLWCGLGMGTINASVMQSVFSPVGIENPAVDSVIISMGGINNNAVFDRVSLPSPDHPGAIAAITGDHSRPIHLELDTTNDNMLLVRENFTSLHPPGKESFYANNTRVFLIPEPGKYAMVLVGLGLIGFTLRRRTIKFQQRPLFYKQRIGSEHVTEFQSI